MFAPRVSIRSALLLVVLVSLVPAFLIVYTTGAEHARKLEEEAASAALRVAVAFGDTQLRITESTREMLSTLAALPAFREGNTAIAERVLKSVHAGNPDYLNLTVTDGAGIATASSLLARGTDLSARPHVRRALATGRFSAGEYLIGFIQSEPSFSYSLPLLDETGRIRGTITALYKLTSYASLFESFDLATDSFLGIVDRHGVRLYFYPPREANPVGAAIRENVWERIKAGPETGTFMDESSDGIDRFFGYRKLMLQGEPDPYITVVYAVPRDKILRESRRITVRNLLAMSGAAATALGLAWALSEFLFGRRLSRIGAAVDRIRGGDLAARVGLDGDSSDLGRIASALDGMARAVQRRDSEREVEARRLGRLVEEKEVLLKEVHHRVKNNLQMTLSLIRLQEGAASDSCPGLKGLEARISAMATVHEMLYSRGGLTDIDLCEYSGRLLDLLQDTYSVNKSLSVSLSCDAVTCSLDKAIPFGLLLTELVTNTFKHASNRKGRGAISVSLTRGDGGIRLSVKDDGPGLPADFDPRASSGLGLQLVSALAEQLGGSLSWETDGGALFRVEFPA